LGCTAEAVGSIESAAESDACSGSICTINNRQTGFFVPGHVGGDADFKGHGPNVYTRVDLWTSGNQIWATLYVHATETQSDWTEAEGSTSFLVHTAQGNIAAMLSDTASELEYTDYNHQRDSFAPSRGAAARRFECVGDTRGNEAGSRTGCQAFFRPITFQLQ
jgi:hypothetical protein